MKKNRKLSAFGVGVYAAARKIPRGKVSTYAAIARAIGAPRAARAVGNALNKNPFKSVPCHRVILSLGQLGGYASGPAKKAKRLRSEGVLVEKSKIDLERFCFNF